MLIWLSAQRADRRFLKAFEGHTEIILAHSSGVASEVVARLEHIQSSRPETSFLRGMTKEKIRWSDKIHRHLVYERAYASESSGVLDSRVASVLGQDLSLVVVPACLDTIFAWERLRRHQVDEVTAVISPGYSTPQWPSIAWWLAVLDQMQRTGIKVNAMSPGDRSSKSFEIQDWVQRIDADFSSTRALTGRWQEAFDDGGSRPVVYWAGGVRRAALWESRIVERHPEATGVIRLSNNNLLYMRDECLGPLALLSCNWHSSDDGFQHLVQSALSCLESVCGCEEASWQDTALEAASEYIDRSVFARWSCRISRLTEHLKDNLEGRDIVDVYTVDTPVMEALAVMNWALQQGQYPTLLPHSFMSRYVLFPRSSFKKACVYFSATEVTPQGYWDRPSNHAEEVVPPVELSKDSRDGRVSEMKAIGRGRSPFVSSNIIAKFGRGVRRLCDGARRFKHQSEARVEMMSRDVGSAWRIKCGYMLNWESHSFATEIDVLDHAQFVSVMASELQDVGGDDVGLIIRAKPAFTHPKVFMASMSKWAGRPTPPNVIMSPLSRSLRDFGRDVDVVLVVQASSAHLELMDQGVAMVVLTHPQVPMFCSGSGYVELPEDVVPRMSMEQMWEQIHLDPCWCRRNGDRQKQWARRQQIRG